MRDPASACRNRRRRSHRAHRLGRPRGARAAHHTRRDALVSIGGSAGDPARCTRTSPTAALLEWLPQGTIVHDGAYAASTTRIDVAADAAFIGTEIVSLGRRAAGERFRCGEWRQRFEIVRDGAPIWSERAVLKGDGELLASAVGLNGAPVFGTFVAVMPGSSDTMMPALRELSAVQGQGSVTRLPDIVVARYVGDSMEAAGAYFMDAWSIVRPLLTGLVAVRPRIFST